MWQTQAFLHRFSCSEGASAFKKFFPFSFHRPKTSSALSTPLSIIIGDACLPASSPCLTNRIGTCGPA